MNFSFPIHSKQEQAKIALNNARSIQMAKLGLLKLYEDMQSKKNKLASNNSAQKLSDEKENDDAVRKYIQEEAKKAAAAAAAAAPPNKSFGLNKLLKKINYKKH